MGERRVRPYQLVTGRLTAGRVELHVFARAYSDAWIAVHSEPPSGSHRFADLGLVIDFGRAAAPRKPSRRKPQRMTSA